MKKEKKSGQLPEEMADIKSGRIFEIPPDYFSHLNDQFFDQKDQYHPPHQNTRKIIPLRLWWIAASIALLVSVAWWYSSDVMTSSSSSDVVNQGELGEYIQSEIMEYDLESLAQNLSDNDLNPISQDDAESYQSYIEEHLEDFEDIIYNQ